MATICGWVQNRQLLQLVSGDNTDCLTPAILTRWLDSAINAVVIANNVTDEPVGFCTLSSTEVSNAPPYFVELCHLLVDPRCRYLFIGPRISKAAKSLAKQHGFSDLYGRVVPHHKYGLVLARSEQFIEIVPPQCWLPSGFQWFQYHIAALES